MPAWGALDVRHIREAKGMSQEAKVLHVAVTLYCAERETDGDFSRAQLLALAEEAEATTDPIKIAAAWVARGVWEKTSDGWRDLRFLDVNPSHADREANRKKAADWRRKQKEARDAAGARTGSRTGTRTDNRTDRTESKDSLSSAGIARSPHQGGPHPDSENSSGSNASASRFSTKTGER
jgi:hypothetical protein